MSLKIKKSAGGIHIDEGEYVAIVESIQARKWDDGGESYGWTFKIKKPTLDGEPLDGPARIMAFATAILTPKSKLSKWAAGAGLNVDQDEIDLEDAVGKTVKVYVEDRETKEGAVVSTISKVKQVKKSEEVEKKKKQATDDDEDEKPKKKKEEKKTKSKVVDDDDEEEVEEKPKNKKNSKKVEKDEDDDEDDDKLFEFDEDEDEDDD